MRTFQITINGQEYTVEIEDPNASPTTVLVNGKAFAVSVDEQTAATRPAASSSFADTEADEAYMPVVATTFVATVPQVDDAPTEMASPAAAAAQGAQQITAPMPGKIMDIVAQVGDHVKQGDVMCSLEAMKMKSPIRSTGDAVVAQVLICEGQNVKFGDVLFTLN